ncbi:MAG: antitoxin YezG family protein [Clostridia bacterium]|nr:antitoxin YezG family protein [Clostridia bacterium]
MLNHTKKVKEIYEDIQRKLFYMIPEKWDRLYLYSSILDEPDEEGKTGELFFYYIPKGIFKKKAVNVYEIPAKFNLDESQYLRLVQLLYAKIKELRKEFRKSERNEIWSNITMTIQSLKFKVEYDYTDLVHSDFSSYERHVIWRYEMLGIGEEQVSKEDKEILRRYQLGAKTLARKEHYDSGIYIRDIENVIAYSNENASTKEVEEIVETTEKKRKNQLLLSKEEIEKMKNQ